MKTFTTSLLEKVKDYVRGIFTEKFSEKIYYHNIDHTLDVVAATEIIGRECDLSPDDLEKVMIAAWFHDIGYYLGQKNHEEASADIASDFLKKEGVKDQAIEQIRNCILATKIPQSPKNQLEKILCDADLYHLSTNDFLEKTELLWREYSMSDPELIMENWLNVSRDFVSKHAYHTPYGKEILQPALTRNLKLLDAKIKNMRKE